MDLPARETTRPAHRRRLTMPKKAGLGDALKKVTAVPTTAPAPDAVHDDHRPPSRRGRKSITVYPRSRRPSATAPARARTRQLRSTDGRRCHQRPLSEARQTAHRRLNARMNSMPPCPSYRFCPRGLLISSASLAISRPRTTPSSRRFRARLSRDSLPTVGFHVVALAPCSISLIPSIFRVPPRLRCVPPTTRRIQ